MSVQETWPVCDGVEVGVNLGLHLVLCTHTQEPWFCVCPSDHHSGVMASFWTVKVEGEKGHTPCPDARFAWPCVSSTVLGFLLFCTTVRGWHKVCYQHLLLVSLEMAHRQP